MASLIDELLRNALWGDAARLEHMSLGHLFRDASPTNSPSGEADSLGNPWELVLALEGSLTFAAPVHRRHDAAPRMLPWPCVVYPTGAGYGSALSGEGGRCELWAPLWSKPATYREIATHIRTLPSTIGEGRARRPIRTGLDMAQLTGSAHA